MNSKETEYQSKRAPDVQLKSTPEIIEKIHRRRSLNEDA